MAMEERNSEHKGGGMTVLRHLKNKLTAGLLVVIPVGITIFILKFLFNLADGVLAPVMTRLLLWFHAEADYVPGLGMVTGLIVIYLAGIIATNLLGRRLMKVGDELLERIPFVKSIYSSSKQLTNVFSQSGKENERKPVWVEFPRAGSYALGFQTGNLVAGTGERYVTVFVPTSPNPTSGFVLFVEEERAYPAELTVEEAMKVVVSGGMVTPEKIFPQKMQ